jgi:hypothetical protein
MRYVTCVVFVSLIVRSLRFGDWIPASVFVGQDWLDGKRVANTIWQDPAVLHFYIVNPIDLSGR